MESYRIKEKMTGTQLLLILLIFTHLIAVILILFVNKGFLNFPEPCQYCENFKKLNKPLQLYDVTNLHVTQNFTEDINDFKYKSYDTWRHLIFTIRNMWYFIHSQLENLKKSQNIQNNDRKIVNYIEESGVEYYRITWHELNRLSELEEWTFKRKQDAFKLGEIIQNRIDKLQNPDYCNISNVLLCNLTNPHGLASSMHDVLWCFIKAYQNEMMMVLDISNWHYEIKKWENTFMPLSRLCAKIDISSIKKTLWPGENNEGARSDLSRLPSELGSQLVHLFDQPLVWWYGQFIKYLFRPNAVFEDYLKSKKSEIGFSSPIVGIHVRRSDKINKEAKFHDLEEYMYHVEDYYKRIELEEPRQERKVFVATDDPKVIEECREKYQRYNCLGFSENANLASKLKSRYTNSSLWGTLMDIFFLADCDYVICTFSSGFCRLAYELMYSVQPDAANRIHSLDVEYFYAWKKPPQRKALYSHVPKSSKELWFYKDSLLNKQNEFVMAYSALNGKIWDGFSEGIKVETGEKGLFPIFKTIEQYNLG